MVVVVYGYVIYVYVYLVVDQWCEDFFGFVQCVVDLQYGFFLVLFLGVMQGDGMVEYWFVWFGVFQVGDEIVFVFELEVIFWVCLVQ